MTFTDWLRRVWPILLAWYGFFAGLIIGRYWR